MLRLVLATVFIAHGSQKLFGGFGGGGLFGGLGGGGLSSTARFMAAHGLTPGFLFAVLGGLAEFAGGILIALGLLTVFGAAINIAVQIGAIATQTWAAGFFVAQHSGFEYNLVLIAALLAVAAAPGRVSLDHLLLTHLRHARGPAAPPASASVEAVPPHAG
ncbi:MAG: DoxX family protein [Pseudonocardiaceae bacterium]